MQVDVTFHSLVVVVTKVVELDSSLRTEINQHECLNNWEKILYLQVLVLDRMSSIGSVDIRSKTRPYHLNT